MMDLVAEALPRLSQAAGRHNLAQRFEGMRREKKASSEPQCGLSSGRSISGCLLQGRFTAFG